MRRLLLLLGLLLSGTGLSFGNYAPNTLNPGSGLSGNMAFTAGNRAAAAPRDITLSSYEVAETTPEGTVFATLSAVDDDAGDTFTFALVDLGGATTTDNQYFAISGNQLRLYNVLLDYEKKSSYQIGVRVTDSQGATFTKTLTIAITDVNEPPSDAVLSSSVVPENAAAGTQIGQIWVTDAEGGSYTFALRNLGGDTGADNLAFELVGNSLRTRVPLNFEAKSSYTIGVRVTDNAGGTYDEMFGITVQDRPEAPSAPALSANTVAEGAALDTRVGLVSAVDPDAGASLSYALADLGGATTVDNGAFKIVGNELLTTANFDFETKNAYQIGVRVTDNTGRSAQQTIAVQVTNVNEAPTKLDLSALSIAENATTGAAIGTVSAEDPDASDTFTFTLVDAGGQSAIDNNTFEIEGNELRLRTALDFETRNTYDVGVRVTDAGGLTFDRMFTISVTDANEAPTAKAGPYATDEDVTLTVSAAEGLLKLSSDPEKGDLMAEVVDQPTNGTLSIAGDGSFTYTPAKDYNGTDAFTFRVGDGNSFSAPATVELTIKAVNDAPVAADDAYTTGEDVALVVAAPGPLGNDTDIEGQSLSAVKGDGPTHGTLTLGADGGFTYTPEAGFHGEDSFTYHVVDAESATSVVATVKLTVSAINDAPVAAADTYTTAEDQTLVVNVATGVLANDTDPDGDALTVTVVAAPTHGTLALAADGSFRYVPKAEYSGDDAFTYAVADEGGLSASAAVTITVTEVNDAPKPVVIDEEAADSTVTLNVDPDALFTMEWPASTDSEGDKLSYTWQLSTSADFATVLHEVSAGSSTSVSLRYGDLTDLLAKAGLGESPTATVYHRVVATDGTTISAGTVAKLTFVRGSATGIDDGDVPVAFALYGNYPNPFSRTTTIEFALPEPGEVRLVVFDLMGREVARPVDGQYAAGRHRVVFDAGLLPSGTYFYRFTAEGFTQTKQMVVVR